jgi:hypothetical protein
VKTSELAEALKAACNAAPKGGKVVAIHLFGIRHAASLKGANLKAVAEQGAQSKDYATELRKAMNLAPFVQIIADHG